MTELLNTLVEGFDPTKVQQPQINEDWQKIYAAVQNSMILQAELSGIDLYSVGKGKQELCGHIQLGEVRGLLPLSMSGAKSEQEFRKLNGHVIAFKVENYDRNNNLFTANRTAALEHMSGLLWSRAEQGARLTAVIREVKPMSITVDIGGQTTRIERQEISYAWIDNLTEKYNVGDHIQVEIIRLDKEKRLIQVSHKATLKNPYPDCLLRFKQAGEYPGKVTGVVEYGFFVNVAPGVDVLCKNIRSIGTYQKGDKIIVKIKKIDMTKKEMFGEIKRRV
ncbi:S1 RNA-binding domain-containing protein [Paenibacillus sp. LjRoot153]|uniref:S1 RNA-binding domain-containing protein n=1 Tax=Paenibacillus sp. LjRoot153 TaxID=3342270 RepID=UPI003ECF6BB6